MREAIRTAGITHGEVARSTGMDPSKLSKSLAGTRRFRVEEISRIARITGVTTDWLTSGRGVPSPRPVDSHLRGHRPSSVATVGTAGDSVRSTASSPDDQSRVEADESLGSFADVASHDPSIGRWMSKGKRSRRTIVAVAWELYADRGIDNVRTSDIAAATGFTTSAINYHFRTKTALLEAALRYSLEIIAGARDLTDPKDAVAALWHFARIHSGIDTKIRRVWSIWLQSWAVATVDESARLNLRAVYTEWLALLTGVVATGQKQGAVRPGDATRMVKGLAIFIDGLGIARSTRQMAISDAEAFALLGDYLTAHVLTESAHLPTAEGGPSM